MLAQPRADLRRTSLLAMPASRNPRAETRDLRPKPETRNLKPLLAPCPFLR